MKKSAILALSLVLIVPQSLTFLTAAQATEVLNRNSIDPFIPQKSPLVKCLSQQQLDCVERVAVEHTDGSFEEAKFVTTRIVDFPNENGQKVQYGDLLFDFRNENKNGSVKRLRLSTHVISPTGTFNGKKLAPIGLFCRENYCPMNPHSRIRREYAQRKHHCNVQITLP